MPELVMRRPIRIAGAKSQAPSRPSKDSRCGNNGQPAIPPERTNAENFYYAKQIQLKTPMVIVLRSGEVIRGVIQWYDKACLKVAREGAPSLLIYKPAIRYMYKATQER